MKKFLVYILASLMVLQQPVIMIAENMSSIVETQMDEFNDVDEGIYNLVYNKNEVLATNGDEIESFIPREGILSGDKFIVVERNKKSLKTTPIDISIVDSMTDRTYPGAIQLADIDLVNNQPNIVSVKRNPINISIDLPGMRSENTKEVKNPTYGNVKGAIDGLISDWSDKHSKTHSLPARIQYSESMVHSESQLSSALNINSGLINNGLGIDFESISNGDKKTMVAAYKQIFYTVSAERPHNPSDLFDGSVTFRDLERRGVSNERPPVMVSNVSYGRTIYVKLETTSKSDDVEVAFKTLLNDDNENAKRKYEDILEESSFTAIVLGGDPREHNKVVTTDFEEIRDIIKNNAEFSLRNPGYPISYTSTFLKDNAVAAINNNTEYIETNSQEYSSGKIKIDHRGAYVAQFEITWDEVSYDEDGKEVLEHKEWDGNREGRTARFTTVMHLPANARNIKIHAKECTGLAWEWWRTVIDEKNVPLAKEINISLGGTTLNPRGNISYK